MMEKTPAEDAACRPCELRCYDPPPPEWRRPWTCPLCKRRWERTEEVPGDE